LSPTSGYCFDMLKCTYGEFTQILSLLEILFLNLCLFLFINVYIKIHNSYKCICLFLRLFLGQIMCRRKFGFNSVIFIFICISPLNGS
jgi:dolichol kinase